MILFLVIDEIMTSSMLVWEKKKKEYYSFENFILFFIIFNLSNWNPSNHGLVSNHEDEEDSTNFYIHNVTSDVSRVLDEF
jgi:hypothetical protein